MKRLGLFIICLSTSIYANDIEIHTEVIPGKFKGKELSQLVEGAQFEFWNQSNSMLFIKLGTFDKETGYIFVEPGARLISQDRIIRLVYTFKEDPTFVHDVDYFILNPKKTSYLTLKDNKFMPQQGGIFQKKTWSGLSTQNNITFNDLILLPYPKLPYDLARTPTYISAVRDSRGELDVIEWNISQQIMYFQKNPQEIVNIVNQPGLWGWTALHEAAFQGYDQIFNYLVDKGGDVTIKDLQGRTPEEVKNMKNLSYVLAAFYSPAIDKLINYFDTYIAKLQRYIQSMKQPKFMFATLPIYSEKKVEELAAAAQKEYRAENEGIKHELKFNVLDKQDDKYLKKFGDLSIESAELEYPDIEAFINQINTALSYNDPEPDKLKRLIDYDQLYEHIGLDKNDRKKITIEEIQKKIFEKNQEIGFPQSGPEFVILREVSHVLTGGYKELYDALLSGQDAYNKTREDFNRKVKSEKLIEEMQRVITFSEIVRSVAE